MLEALKQADGQIIFQCAEQLGVDLEKHIGFVIESLRAVAGELGIARSS